MGGWGSGRHWHNTRIEAESCKALAIRDIRQAIKAGPGFRGGLTWRIGDQETGSIDFEIVTSAAGALGVRLMYTIGKGRPEAQSFDYVVPLEPLTLYGGGIRYYFECRASRDGGPVCGRRVGKLYLPRGGQVFACRHCYNLTYRSCNESHKYDGMYRHLAAQMAPTYPGMDWRTIKRLFSRRYGG